MKIIGSVSRRRRPARRVLLAKPCLRLEPLEDRSLPSALPGFAGLAFSDDPRFIPPDTHAAVGPDHVVEVVNASVAVFDKDTRAKLFQRQLQPFFARVGAATPTFDPVVAYDELSGRFIVATLEQVPGNQTSFVDVAVSNTSNPLDGFAEMHRIELTEVAGGQRTFADYPKIGYNADAIVISFNMFGFTGGYFNVQVLSIDKPTALDLNPATLTRFRADVPGGRAHQTMAVATMHGAAPGDPMYFVEEAGFANGRALRVVRMTDVLNATPTFANFNIPVTPYGFPPLATQPGGAVRTNDTRVLNAAWRGDRLVASQTVGSGGAARARWYEFNTGGTPALTQSGQIAPGAGVHNYFPSIEIAADGSLGMTYMQSSFNEFVSMYVTGRTEAEPLGVMRTPLVAKAGEAFLRGAERAGDYSGISVDPEDGTLFWAANEYARSSPIGANWATWITVFGASWLPPASSGTSASDEGEEFESVGDEEMAEPRPLLPLLAESVDESDADGGGPEAVSALSRSFLGVPVAQVEGSGLQTRARPRGPRPFLWVPVAQVEGAADAADGARDWLPGWRRRRSRPRS